MLVLIGLGNPGNRYKNHRHNIGFQLVDAISDHFQLPSHKRRFASFIRAGTISAGADRTRIICLQPQTFMNASGDAAQKVMSYYKLRPDQLIVFHDELDLTPGKFRMKTGGGSGGHNGIRSIAARIGPEFHRARLGIGHPGHKSAVTSYVLSDFTGSEKQAVQTMIDACVDAIAFLLAGDHQRYQSEVNRLRKPTRREPAGQS